MRPTYAAPFALALAACAAKAPTSAADKPLVPPTECPTPAGVLARSGETVARPSGESLRLLLAYQGASVGVMSIHGVEARPLGPGPNEATPVAGQHAGYWGELRDAAGTKLFFVAFPDVVEREVPPPPGGGEFSHVVADRCEAKIMAAHVPNDASATDFVVFGSPYGTRAPAVEIGRFKLGPPR